jgi:hypothetical protein
MTQAIRDQNFVTVALGVSSSDSTNPLPFSIDGTTGRLRVDASSSGTGLTQETPTGTVNGVNTTFTTSNTPVSVLADNVMHPVSTSVNDFGGNAVTYVGTTITFNALTPPVQYVVSYYNS